MLNWTVWNRTIFDSKTELFEIELFWLDCVWTKTILILNWIAWNKSVFDKLCTHAKLNSLK